MAAKSSSGATRRLAGQAGVDEGFMTQRVLVVDLQRQRERHGFQVVGIGDDGRRQTQQQLCSVLLGPKRGTEGRVGCIVLCLPSLNRQLPAATTLTNADKKNFK